jgi:hypothetical protein
MRLAAFALLTLIASPGWAAVGGTWDIGCDSVVAAAGDGRTINAPGSGSSPHEARVGCWSTVDADTTANSPNITVAAPTALVCFDPDTGGTTTSTSRVKVYRNPLNDPATTFSVNSWTDIGGARDNASLDGTEGSAEAQNACVRVPPGVYVFLMSAACDSDACRVTVEGEK